MDLYLFSSMVNSFGLDVRIIPFRKVVFLFYFSILCGTCSVVSTPGYLNINFLIEVFIISNLDHDNTFLIQFPIPIPLKPVFFKLEMTYDPFLKVNIEIY